MCTEIIYFPILEQLILKPITCNYQQKLFKLAMAIVTAGEPIEIRWKVDAGKAKLAIESYR